MMKRPTLTPKNLAKYYARYGSIKKVWKNVYPDKAWKTVQKMYREAVDAGVMPNIRVGAKTLEQMKNPEEVLKEPRGRVKAIHTKMVPIPKRGVKRYLFTCAQNETGLFMPFWNNLLKLREHYRAQLHVARFVYVNQSLAAMGDKKQLYERAPRDRYRELWWAPAIVPYLSDERLEIAPGLVWCGEMNILPTANRPLSGLEVYTGRNSGIFPHVKIAMDSIPSSKHAATKFNFTTGTATLRNYIGRKAGLKAEFHHCYGALLVEVDADGDWFCRQIVADSEGTIHDLDVKVENEVVTTGNSVEAITWGDIHVAEMVEWVNDLSFGEGGIRDTLKPKYNFYHDVYHMRAKSHHEIKNPHISFKRYVEHNSNVENEVVQSANWLDSVHSDAVNVIVHSNHHDHIGVWLREQNAIFDPKNAEYWLRLNEKVLGTIRLNVLEGNSKKPVNYYVEALKVVGYDTSKFKFLDPDESFIICDDRGGGIECGMHGHSGPNGSRGNPLTLAKLGRKANIGHVHRAGIIDGIYHAGTCGQLDPDWTTGPSSWSHSHVITYPNGKRTIVTLWNNKWRGE